jgi:hypothetical protein
MVSDQRQSLQPRHTLIILSLHTLISLLIRIACLKFTRAEMPSSSTPFWRRREQEATAAVIISSPACIASHTQYILAHSTRDSS